MELLLEQLVDEFVAGGEEAFRSRHSTPALVVSDLPPDDEEDERDFFTLSADWRELRETMELRRPRGAPTIPPPSTASAPKVTHRPPVKVFPVRKRAGGAFRERIGVGRAVNADVSIPLPALSKYHAYFTVPEGPDGDYTLTDAGSKNGTWVEGRRLDAKETATVVDGSEIRLGPYTLIFQTPEGLLERVQRAARLR